MPWYELMGEDYFQTRKDWLTTPEEQKWMLQARSIMLRHLGRPFDGEQIADIGCSAGHGARTFLKKPVGHRARDDQILYYGFDNEMEYLAAGEDLYAHEPRVVLRWWDASTPPPFARPVFEFVICNNVPIHLPGFLPCLENMLHLTSDLLIWRTMLGEKEIIWQSPKNGIHLNQYAFSDVLPFIRDSGFEVKVLQDAYLNGVPQLVWEDQIRTYYVVVARRK